MRDGGDAAVHVGDGLADLEEDREELRLRERPALAQALVQDVQQRPPRAELHHDDRLLPPVDDGRERALQLDDVLVPGEDFLFNLKYILVFCVRVCTCVYHKFDFFADLLGVLGREGDGLEGVLLGRGPGVLVGDVLHDEKLPETPVLGKSLFDLEFAPVLRKVGKRILKRKEKCAKIVIYGVFINDLFK